MNMLKLSLSKQLEDISEELSKTKEELEQIQLNFRNTNSKK